MPGRRHFFRVALGVSLLTTACRSAPTEPREASTDSALMEVNIDVDTDARGEAGRPDRFDAAPAQPDLATVTDSAPPSCDQRLLELDKTYMLALACVPANPASCKSTVEALCGCRWGVGDPGSAETRAFTEAVRAYQSAGCVAPCPDAGVCPTTTGGCSSPGQARPPVFTCSY
jgi:hypothetical protein